MLLEMVSIWIVLGLIGGIIAFIKSSLERAEEKRGAYSIQDNRVEDLGIRTSVEKVEVKSDFDNGLINDSNEKIELKSEPIVIKNKSKRTYVRFENGNFKNLHESIINHANYYNYVIVDIALTSFMDDKRYSKFFYAIVTYADHYDD